MDKLVLMVEVWMTLVIIFGSEKVSGTDWFTSVEIFHIWWIISSILIWLSKTDKFRFFWNIVLNNWLIDFKPFCIFDNEGRKIEYHARLLVRLLKGREKVFMWSTRMLITITATVLQGFKRRRIHVHFLIFMRSVLSIALCTEAFCIIRVTWKDYQQTVN